MSVEFIFSEKYAFDGFLFLVWFFMVLFLCFVWFCFTLLKTWSFIGQNSGEMWGQANVNIFTGQVSFSKSLISLTMLSISEEHWLGKSIQFLFNNPNFFSSYPLGATAFNRLLILGFCREFVLSKLNQKKPCVSISSDLHSYFLFMTHSDMEKLFSVFLLTTFLHNFLNFTD